MKQFRRFYGYVKKDALLLYKRKKYLYTFLLLPIIIASLFLLALNPSSYNIRVGICDFDNTEISQKSFEDLEDFIPVLLQPDDACLDRLDSLIKSGDLDLGLEIGEGFSDNLQNLRQAKLVVYYDNTDVAFANLVSWKVDQSLQPFKREIIGSLNNELTTRASAARTGIDILLDLRQLPSSVEGRVEDIDDDLAKVEQVNTEFLTNPIWTDKRPIYEGEGLQKDAGIIFIFPILALFIILMLSSTSIIYDKNTHFITRVKSSASPVSYILAKTLFFTFLVFVQFVLVLLLFMLYGAQYVISPAIVELVLFVGVINALLGFIIGLLSNNEGIAVLLSLMVSFPLMLISGIFFPVQALPKITQWVAEVLPLSYQINASKTVLLFGQSMNHHWLYAAVALFLIVLYLVKKD